MAQTAIAPHRTYPSPILCCDDIDCVARQQQQATWYRAHRVSIEAQIASDDRELADDDCREMPALVLAS